MKKLFYIVLLFCGLVSCNVELTDVKVPEIRNSILTNTVALSNNTISKLEAVYKITNGAGYFGDNFVLKWTGKQFTAFTVKDEAYIVLKSGFDFKNIAFFVLNSGTKDNSIFFEGYWRNTQGKETGIAQFVISSANGADSLLNGLNPVNLIIEGKFGNNNDNPDIEIKCEFVKPINRTDTNFRIIGHRGGGRNVDRLGASENSLNMIKLSEALGCNGIEIDVRLTKDKVPVLFHDDYLSNRLIREDYFIGKISEYTFSQLRTFCTLINGEKIPTLREALETVVNETNLKLVWLDTKAPGLIKMIEPLRKEMIELAKSKNRNLDILIGIPDEDVFNEFVAYDGFRNSTAVCELTEEYVDKSNALVWAPRWSLGLLTERTKAMHQKGKRVFVWTLDVPEFIHTYIQEGSFDGILTNYASIVAYEYYLQK